MPPPQYYDSLALGRFYPREATRPDRNYIQFSSKAVRDQFFKWLGELTDTHPDTLIMMNEILKKHPEALANPPVALPVTKPRFGTKSQLPYLTEYWSYDYRPEPVTEGNVSNLLVDYLGAWRDWPDPMDTRSARGRKLEWLKNELVSRYGRPPQYTQQQNQKPVQQTQASYSTPSSDTTQTVPYYYPTKNPETPQYPWINVLGNGGFLPNR